MFKSFFCLLLCVGLCAGDARSTFCAKLKDIAITFWSQDNLCKLTDFIIEDVRTGVPMKNITGKALGYVTKVTPLLDYGKLMTLMNNMDKCLKDAGRTEKTMDVLNIVAPVFENQLKNPYSTIRTKMVTMQGNKKPVADQKTQAYTLATASVTKPLIQTIISNCSKKMLKQLWACAVPNLKTVIAIQNYNTTKVN